MITDYYVVLGVPRNATTRQIRQRFLELARQRHPDHVLGEGKAEAEAEFQRLTEAFNVLADPNRRREHDALLAAGASGPQPTREELARVYVQRGIKAYRAADWRSAVDNFEHALEESPADPEAWYHLALTLGRERRTLPRARTAATKACELKEMDARYWTLAGRLFADSGMFDQAEQHYRRAREWGADATEVEEALAALRSRSRLFGSSS
ncbi:MAG: J domain-containing protein [Thermoanaerobaculia bacterium]